MGVFTFKLQPLLNIKKQMEDSLKNDLGKAVQKLEHEKDILASLESEMYKNIEMINKKAQNLVQIKTLKEFSIYISHLKEKIEAQKDNVKYEQYCVDNYREKLVKAVQEREILEKLKERKYQEYLREQLKEEQKLNDEIVSFNLGSRDMNGGG